MCLWTEAMRRFKELPNDEQAAILQRIRNAEAQQVNIRGYVVPRDDDSGNNPSSSHEPD